MIYELMKEEVNLGKENMNMSQIEEGNSSGNKSPRPYRKVRSSGQSAVNSLQ